MAKVFKPISGLSGLVAAGSAAASTSFVTANAGKEINAIRVVNTTANPAYITWGKGSAVAAAAAGGYYVAGNAEKEIPVEFVDVLSAIRIGSTDTSLHVQFGKFVLEVE